MNQLEKEIKAIKERNRRVELDKMWETSSIRRLLVALLTYITITIFFIFAKVENPFLNAIVPTLGFLLSTLTLNFFKKIWLRNMLKSKDIRKQQ